MRKQSLIIVSIVLCMITMAVGYSIFRTNTEVSGKTAAAKNLEVVFIKIGDIKQEGSVDAAAFISNGGKSVTINVPKLTYKGAYVDVPITIKNIGTLPARLQSISQFGVSNDASIDVSYNGIGITDAVLNPGDEQSFNVKVSWARDLLVDVNNCEFLIRFNYVQG